MISYVPRLLNICFHVIDNVAPGAHSAKVSNWNGNYHVHVLVFSEKSFGGVRNGRKCAIVLRRRAIHGFSVSAKALGERYVFVTDF